MIKINVGAYTNEWSIWYNSNDKTGNNYNNDNYEVIKEDVL